MSWHKDFNSQRFAIVPVEAMMDRRFKPRHLAVFMALTLHADKSGVCTLSNATIEEISGVKGTTNVSATTRDLETWGYITEKKQTGFNACNRYVMGAPIYPDDALRVVESRSRSAEDYAKVAEGNRLAGIARGQALRKPAAERAYYVPAHESNDGEAISLSYEEALRHFAVWIKHKENPGYPVEWFSRWGFKRQDTLAIWSDV